MSGTRTTSPVASASAFGSCGDVVLGIGLVLCNVIDGLRYAVLLAGSLELQPPVVSCLLPCSLGPLIGLVSSDMLKQEVFVSEPNLVSL